MLSKILIVFVYIFSSKTFRIHINKHRQVNNKNSVFLNVSNCTYNAPVQVNPPPPPPQHMTGPSDHKEDSDNNNSFLYHSDITIGNNMDLLGGDFDWKLMAGWGFWQNSRWHVHKHLIGEVVNILTTRGQ